MILVACHGNINRSAAVHVLLLSLGVSGQAVQSCGFVNPGRRMAKKMRDSLMARGYPQEEIEEHRSQLISQKLVQQATKVFYMDKGNLARLMSQFSQFSDKFVPLGQYADIPVHRIPDPAFMKKGSIEFLNVVDLLISCATNLHERELQNK